MKKHCLPMWILIFLDVLAAALCVGIVVLFLYIIPQGTKIEEKEEEITAQFTLPSAKEQTDATAHSAQSTNAWSHADTISLPVDQEEIKTWLSGEKSRTMLQTYHTDQAELTIEQVTGIIGGEPIRYYAADIYVISAKLLRTAFAQAMFGRNIRAFVTQMARENDAILAISGDSYGESDAVCVIRNGTLYENQSSTSDICVLFTDGTMKTYGAAEFQAEEVMKQGAWQAWTFGPALLDNNGNIPDAFHSTEYLNKKNPRAAIGYLAPGHYKWIVVDGRQEASAGVTMSELAAIMQEEGCLSAYNLDGGKSAVMVYDGKNISHPIGAGRTISDILYIPADKEAVK